MAGGSNEAKAVLGILAGLLVLVVVKKLSNSEGTKKQWSGNITLHNPMSDDDDDLLTAFFVSPVGRSNGNGGPSYVSGDSPYEVDVDYIDPEDAARKRAAEKYPLPKKSNIEHI
jgi:hypothetical protein